MNEITITKHAYSRAKERLNWKKVVLDKMSKRAYDSGVTHSQTGGALNRYITKLWAEYKTANNIRIYGEHIFLFCGHKLITLYRVPNKFKNHLKTMQ